MATETETAKPKPSAHFSMADNLEYEIPVDDHYHNKQGNNDGGRARMERRRSSLQMRNSILTKNYDISYHPDKLILFSPPRQRQKWGDTQVLPRVNYGDLFFDLFFVGAAYNIGNLLVEDPSFRGLLYFLATFTPLYGLWLDKSFYDSRFVVIQEDVWHRVFELAVLVALAAAVLHIRPVDIMSNGKDNVDSFAFCLSVLIANVLNQWRYFEIYLFGIGQPVIKEEAKRYGKMTSIYFVMVLIATVLAGIEHYGPSSLEEKDYESKADPYDYHTRNLAGSTSSSYATSHSEYDLPMYLILAGSIWRWLQLAVDVMFFFPGGGKHKERIVPINVDFTIHRNGEWNMLMLGESILSLLIVDVNENDDYYATFYSALLTVILLQYLHFRSQPHHADGHALRRNKDAGVWWTVFHQIYSAALIAVGAAFTLLVLEFTYDDYPSGEGDHRRFLAGGGGSKYGPEERRQRSAHLFCFSLAIVWFCLDCMTLLHLGLKNSHDRCQCSRSKKFNVKGIIVVTMRVLLLAFMVTLSQYETNPEDLAIFGLMGVLLQLVLRKLGTHYLSGHNQVYALDQGEGGTCDGQTGTADPEDMKWPNVTHAQATPQSKGGEH